MKRILPILATVTLALTACSGGEQAAQQPNPDTLQSELAQAYPSDGATPSDGLTEISESDPIPFTCYSHMPCDATFTPEMYAVSDECKGRVDSYGQGPELADGQTLLQAQGIFEVKSAANGWTMMDDPTVITKDGLTKTMDMTVNCHEPKDLELWSTTVDAGQKSQVFGAWIIPEDAEYMVLGGAKMKLPANDGAKELSDVEGGQAPAAPQPAAEQPAPAPAAAEAPYVVECLFGTPGPSLMSDGTTQNTEYCGNQPGAQEYRDAESAAGYDPTKNYEDPQLPAYLTRTPEESRQQAEGQGWWSNCMATNTAEHCRATDPYQQ